MTRTDYLEQAKQWPGATISVLALAQKLTNLADIEAHAEKLAVAREAHVKVGVRWLIAAGVYVAVLVVGLVLLLVLAAGFQWHPLAMPGWNPIAIIGSLILVLFVCGNRTASHGGHIKALDEELASLNPIAGTEQCHEALGYLDTDYSLVTAWRDLAIAERGQLYGFDVAVLHDLVGASEHLARLAQKKAVIDTACRKVHGIAPDTEPTHILTA